MPVEHLRGDRGWVAIGTISTMTGSFVPLTAGGRNDRIG
jgi:hypothetical protein